MVPNRLSTHQICQERHRHLTNRKLLFEEVQPLACARDSGIRGFLSSSHSLCICNSESGPTRGGLPHEQKPKIASFLILVCLHYQERDLKVRNKEILRSESAPNQESP